jgi:hypothetical protein
MTPLTVLLKNIYYNKQVYTTLLSNAFVNKHVPMETNGL